MIATDIWYPDTCPAPLRANHTASPVTPFERTEMASGRAESRLMFDSVPEQHAWSILCRTDMQAAMFESWFRDAIANGTAWFNIKRKTPLGPKTVLQCRFVTMYTRALSDHNNWLYSFTLESWERPLLPEGWGLFPDLLKWGNIIDRATNEYWPLYTGDN